MPKFRIDWDEKYPDYYLDEVEGSTRCIVEIELTENEHQQYLAAKKAYEYWQEKFDDEVKRVMKARSI